MTTIDTIMKDDILDKLSLLTIANGFSNDVSVLDGYLVHYANDLLQRENDIGFPCVAVQPESDSVQVSPSQIKGKMTRIIKLVGAVNAVDRSLVNGKLNQLVYDVRKVIAIDKYTNDSLATGIELGETNFTLPDKQEQYAYFEMAIKINYIELWS